MPEITALSDLTKTPGADVFERREPRTVRLHLDADQHIPPHRHPGTNVVLHVLEGRLELTLDDDTYELGAGELIRFSGDRDVSPHALDDSVAILVFAPVVA